MRRRWTADEITRLLREADRDLAKGLTVSDICRKHGIGQSMYYRWRQKRDPDKVDTDRRCRELELEVDRLKKLVAELLLDKTMLQDVARNWYVRTSSEQPPISCASVMGSRNGGFVVSWDGLVRCCDTAGDTGPTSRP